MVINWGLAATVFLLLISVLNAVQVTSVQCREADLTGNETFVATGYRPDSVTLCRYLCWNAQKSYAEVQKEMCFCSLTGGSIGSWVNPGFCNNTCSDGQSCGGLEGFISHYTQLPTPLKHLSLSHNATGGTSIVSRTVLFNISALQFEDTFVGVLDYGDGTKETVNGLRVTLHRYSRIGNYTASVLGNDSFGIVQQARSSTIIVWEPLGEIDITCCSSVLWLEEAIVKFYITRGSHLTVSLEISHKSIPPRRFAIPITGTFTMGNILPVRTTSMSGELVFLMHDLTIQRTSNLDQVQVSVSDSGKFQFQIYRPTCDSPTVYCHAKRACIRATIPNFKLTCEIARGFCDNLNEIFSMAYRRCVPKPDSNVMLPKYQLLIEKSFEAISPGLVNVTMDSVKVIPGDIPAVYQSSGKLGLTENVDHSYYFSPTKNYKVYLRNSQNRRGIIFVTNGREEGTICSRGFNNSAAAVVCRELGFNGDALVVRDSRFGSANGKVVLDWVACQGNENSLAECSTGVWGHHTCLSNESSVGVVCDYNSTKYYTYLQTSDDLNVGRVLVAKGDKIGTICKSNMTENDVNMICKSIGREGLNILFIFGSVQSLAIDTFPVVLDNMQCTNTSTQMEDCPNFTFQNVGDTCSTHSAVINCKPLKTKLQFDLINRRAPNIGLLMATKNDRRGTVCGDKFDDRAARIVCKQLGLTGPAKALFRGERGIGSGSGAILLSNIVCKGEPPLMENCAFDFDDNNCTHEQDVGVQCGHSLAPFIDNFAQRNDTNATMVWSLNLNKTNNVGLRPIMELSLSGDFQMEIGYNLSQDMYNNSLELCTDVEFNITLTVQNTLDPSVPPSIVRRAIELLIPVENVTFDVTVCAVREVCNMAVAKHNGWKHLYVWNFGDGLAGLSTINRNISHIYYEAGVYDVRLITTNSISQWISSKRVQVFEAITSLSVAIDPFAPTSPGDTVKIEVLLSQGSNVTLSMESDITLNVTGNQIVVPFNVSRVFQEARHLSTILPTFENYTSLEHCLTACIKRVNCFGALTTPAGFCSLYFENIMINESLILYNQNNYVLYKLRDGICSTSLLQDIYSSIRLSASSAMNGSLSNITLSSPGGWEAENTTSEEEDITIQFPGAVQVFGVRLGANLGVNKTIGRLELFRSDDNLTWVSMGNFIGSENMTDETNISFDSVKLQWLKIVSTANNTGARIEVIGCSASQLSSELSLTFNSSLVTPRYVKVTASNFISSVDKILLVNIEHPIRNFSLSQKKFEIDEAPYNTSGSFEKGSNIKMNTLLNNITNLNFVPTTIDGSIGYYIITQPMPIYGSYSFKMVADNYVSNRLEYDTVLEFDYKIVDPNLNVVKKSVNRTSLCRIFLQLSLSSRFNLFVDYGDGSNLSAYYDVWNKSVNADLDLSHIYNKTGLFLINLTVNNSIDYWNSSDTVYVLNPILPEKINLSYVTNNVLIEGGTPVWVNITYTGNPVNLPTNASILFTDNKTGAVITTKPIFTLSSTSEQNHLNFSTFGRYDIQLEFRNNVSSFIKILTFEMDWPIENLTISADKSASTVGEMVEFFISKLSGSRINYTINFDDGAKLFGSTNGIENIPKFQHNYTFAKEILSSITATNLVSNIHAQLAKCLYIEYPVKEFSLVGFSSRLLSRFTNTTEPTEFALCLKQSIFTNFMPTNTSYKISFGDHSPVIVGSGICQNKSLFSQPEKNLCGTEYRFCTMTLSHIYVQPNEYNVNVTMYNNISSEMYSLKHTVFSEITNLRKVVSLHPIYSSDDPAQNQSPNFPLEMFIYFNVSTTFGQEMPLLYEWYFDDNKVHEKTSNPFNQHLFAKPGQYNVSVRVHNPIDSETIFQIINIYKSIKSVHLSSAKSYVRSEPYYIDIKVDSMGTNACYVLDLSSADVLNTSKVAFGSESFCGASYRNYFSNKISAHLLEKYAAHINGSEPDTFQFKLETMSGIAGQKNVTLRGWNVISDVSTTWNMVVIKGYCVTPQVDIKTGGGQIMRKRKEKIEINCNIQVSCYNKTTKLNWKILKLSPSGSWLDYAPNLVSFFAKYPNHVKAETGFDSVDTLLRGIWNPSTKSNNHLLKLIIPSFALETASKYRVELNVSMVEEIYMTAFDFMEYELVASSIIPCITGNVAGNILNIKWGDELILDASCSRDEDVFYSSGETDDIVLDWHCHRECEKVLFNSSNNSFTYSAFDKKKCSDKYENLYLGCFRLNATIENGAKLKTILASSWHNWNDFSALPIVKRSAKLFKWKTVGANLTKSIYSMSNSRNRNLTIETFYMFEKQINTFILVASHPTKLTVTKKINVNILNGDPPSTVLNCVSNCRNGLMNKNSSFKIIKLNRFAPFKLQMFLLSRIPGVVYNYEWCIGTPIKDLPDNFDFDIWKLHSSPEICGRNWYSKSSTGIHGSGFSLDLDFPLFEDSELIEDSYYTITVKSWRDNNFANYGLSISLFTLNTSPNIEHIVFSVEPHSGTSLETNFAVTCSGVSDLDIPLTYSFGYSMDVLSTNKGSCTWIIRGNNVCQAKLQLPSGYDQNENMVVLCLLITDRTDMSSFVASQTVKVDNPTININTYLSLEGDGRRILVDLEEAENVDVSIATAMIFFTELNKVPPPVILNSTNTTERETTVKKEDKKLELSNRRMIRSNLLNFVGKVAKPENIKQMDINGILKVSNLLEKGAEKPEEINQDSMNILIESYTSVVESLEEKASDRGISEEVIRQVADSVVNSLDLLYESSNMEHQSNEEIMNVPDTTDGSNNDKHAQFKKLNRENVEKNQKLTRSLMKAFSNKVVVDQKEVSLQSKTFGIKIGKLKPEKLEKKSMHTGADGDCSQFKMSSIEEVFKQQNKLDPNIMENPIYVQSLTTTLSKNSIFFTNVSSTINSRMISMEFSNSENDIYNVTGAESNNTKIEIWVDTSSDQESPEYSNSTTTIPGAPMQSSIISIRQNNALFISVERVLNSDIVDNSSEIIFNIFGQVDERPTETNYAFFCQLPRLHDCDQGVGNTPPVHPTLGDGWNTTVCVCSGNGSCTRVSTSQNVSQGLVNCFCNGTVCYKDATVGEDSNRCDMKLGKVETEAYQTSAWTCFLDSKILNTTTKNKTFYIGIRALKSDAKYGDSSITFKNDSKLSVASKKRPNEDYVAVEILTLMRSTGCYFYNETSQDLETSGCQVGPCSTLLSTQCICTHLTTFMSSVFVPPIKIDMNDSAWLKLDSNPIAFALCIALVCFWILVVIWARKRDMDDLLRAGVTPLPCNDPRDAFAYEITVWTGRRNHASTTAHVTVTLFGENAETSPRLLADEERSILQKGAVNTFLLTTPLHLGPLLSLRLYHDNTGEDPSWYFSRMCVEDIETRHKYYFIGSRWLSVDDGDGMIDAVFSVAGVEEMNGFENVFWTRTNKSLYDGHLWFSVVTRPPRSKFTRVQRATSCLVIIMWTLMVNLMFYGQTDLVESPKLVEIGPLQISPHSIFISVVSALIVIPVNLLIVVLFRNRRDRTKVGPMKGIHDGQLATKYIHEMNDNLENLTRPQTALSMGAISITDVSRNTVKSSEPQLYPPPKKIDSSNCERDTTGHHVKPQGFINKIRALISGIFPLPWWTFIIAYVLSFISVGVTIFLMVEFGGVLGEKKTAEWLGSIALSVAQSILLIQPLKIFIMVLIYAIIFKSPEQDEDEVSKELMLIGAVPLHKQTTLDDLKDPETQKRLQKMKKNVKPPPDEDLLATIRAKRKKDLATQALLKDSAFYVIFLVVITSMAYTNQDYRSFLQNNVVQKTFVEGIHASVDAPLKHFKSIAHYQDLWGYLNDSVLPVLFPNKCYHGSDCEFIQGIATKDMQLYRLRHFQLRQVRIKAPGNCIVNDIFSSLIPRCRQEYDMFSEDTTSYYPGWVSKNVSDKKIEGIGDPWTFTSALKMYGYPFWGQMATYGGGGYVATILGPDLQQAQDSLVSLNNSNWFDGFSRGVFLEFLLYNPNSNLYTVSMMLVEVFNGGKFYMQPKFYTLRISRYVGIYAVFYGVIDALTLILILLFIVKEIKEMRILGKAYFKSFWNILDLVLIVISIVEIGFFAGRIAVQQAVSYYMNKYPQRFINFQFVAFMDETNQALMGMIVFIFTVRFLKMLSFNRKIAMLSEVLALAANPLFQFLILFAIMFFAFAQTGYLMFFRNIDTFKSIAVTVETLGVMSLNKFEFSAFADGAGTLGLFFFFTYMLFVGFILINFFVTIITEAFTIVKAESVNKENDYDLVDYVFLKMKKIFGLSVKKDSENMDQRFAYISNRPGPEEVMEELDVKVDDLMVKLWSHLDSHFICDKSEFYRGNHKPNTKDNFIFPSN